MNIHTKEIMTSQTCRVKTARSANDTLGEVSSCLVQIACVCELKKQERNNIKQ